MKFFYATVCSFIFYCIFFIQVYNQVKTFESCVIYSNSDKYLYRFVFVTDQNIAATENPPKSILWKTDFTEIVKIEKVKNKTSD